MRIRALRRWLRHPLANATRAVLYPLYEQRLLWTIAPLPKPAHIAVMCDGNRRWAREAGFTDVASGHRAGALKIVEMLEWCGEVEASTV